MKKKVLALGDCNTEGDINFKGKAFPELFSQKIKYECVNKGYTMSTTKEMIHFYNDNISEDIDIILIQYGLVDSWQTFKYSPYVLYYPDSKIRKFSRKIIKKYKKICRNVGLNSFLGMKYSVNPLEYKNNIEFIIQDSFSRKIFLIDTIPNKDTKRNKYIIEYNNILDELSSKYNNCYKVDLYQYFEKNLDKFYLDDTHINKAGYEYIASEILDKYSKC